MKLNELILETKQQKLDAALPILEKFAEHFDLEMFDWVEDFPEWDADPDLKNTIFLMKDGENPGNQYHAPIVSWSPSYRPSAVRLLDKDDDIEVKLKSLEQIISSDQHPSGYPFKEILE